MKETIVYLPEEIFVAGCTTPVFQKEEIIAALNEAGVKWTHKIPEELKIRMLEDKVNDLKELCAKLLDENYRLKSGLPQ